MTANLEGVAILQKREPVITDGNTRVARKWQELEDELATGEAGAVPTSRSRQ